MSGSFTSNSSIRADSNFYANDGTNALPSYSFTNETNSGLYYVGANNLGFSINGVKVVDITASGISSNQLFPDGTSGAPSISFTNETTLGFYRPSAGIVELSGNFVIDNTNTEALLVRKNGDTGDVFKVDTSTDIVAITGNLTCTGTLAGLTQAEITQVSNIDTTTISSTQWSYLGGTNQGLSTTDAVSFAQVSVDDIDLNGSVLNFGGATGANIIEFPASLAKALVLKQESAGPEYIVLDTSSQIIELTASRTIIDSTNSAAFTIRKNSGGADVFNINTTANILTMTGTAFFTSTLNVSGDLYLNTANNIVLAATGGTDEIIDMEEYVGLNQTTPQRFPCVPIFYESYWSMETTNFCWENTLTTGSGCLVFEFAVRPTIGNQNFTVSNIVINIRSADANDYVSNVAAKSHSRTTTTVVSLTITGASTNRTAAGVYTYAVTSFGDLSTDQILRVIVDGTSALGSAKDLNLAWVAVEGFYS